MDTGLYNYTSGEGAAEIIYVAFALAVMQPASYATKRNREDSSIPNSITHLPQKLLKTAPNKAAELLETTSSSYESVTSIEVDLCKRCGSLDMDEILSTRPKSSRGRLVKDLGRAEAPIFDPSCSFCRLLSSVYTTTFEPLPAGNLLLYAFPSDGRLWSFEDQVVLLAIKQQSTLAADHQLLCSISPPSYKSNGGTLRARLIASDHIDYSIIHGWIMTCKQDHRICKRVRLQQPMFLRFIDCETREIVSGDISYQYVALSYVWGTSNCQPTASSGETLLLGEDLRTIEDAITVTKALGVRYLWIDRYCINQVDAKEKHTQVRQMDKVYQGAYITIIAAAGSDPTYGLPGVGRTPRVAQPRARVGKHILASLMVHPSVLIKQSVWMSRGWTYQEALCSQRRLIFTDQYVYYECAEANWSETCDLERSWSGWNIFTKGLFGKYPWEVITYISVYAQRQLTYDSDALNGILGILRLLEEEPKYPVFDCSRNSFVDFETVLDDYKKDSFSYPVSPILYITGLAIDLRIQHNNENDLFYTTNDHIRSLYVLPILTLPGSEDITFQVNITESIQKSEATEELLSQTIKGIILGDSARSTQMNNSGLFILAVKRVRTKNGVDEYERLGTGYIGVSRLTECATLQSIFLA
ncbi:hypothetical protein TRIATDRAFT_269934 [Trichoderma atroviride IMI 206040]|uniref:Heterokaryon incompatibility domain-containing protein n=1 Tax=Hypocrea atroviridis (strain ATCC 20476 / IMI 206040) TaxID=452589 RepID=G9NFS2_HYPAI|nr:uncharacterized protein TRIATDRAFT_269934 [Trichoderma atroviride IMI 206040]EHK50785.1 hypothetical protein TRIATDRAFT_269934 [Trichoderma atroviride IMI 206040]